MGGYKTIILKPEDTDLSGLNVKEIEDKVRLWSNELAQCKLLLHTHPGNDRIKKRHDYKCKCVLHGMKTIEERINAREKRKSKNKN
jgi:hypothetical protein